MGGGLDASSGLNAEYKEQAGTGQFYSGVTRSMDRRYWCIILAAAGWLTLGNIERPPHKPAALEGVKGVKYHPDCAIPSDASDAAVCASLLQVRVAEQANAIAANNLMWNEIGITAVVFTLAATAWAAVASSRAYAGFKGSERAHVFIEATTAINFLSDGSDAAVRVRIANRGSTVLDNGAAFCSGRSSA